MSGEWTGQLLPPAATARIAEARTSGTWTSALSTGEFAAIRSVGFEPVGQVMGSAVYRIARTGMSYGYYDCGRYGGVFAMGDSPVQLSGQGSPAKGLVQVLMSARHKAIARMTAECAALGGDGVVAAHLTMAPFPAAPSCFEFQIIGTAVRAQGSVRPRRPFTAHVDGEGFAKLVSSGWIPAELLIGLSIGVRHDDYRLQQQTSWSAGNQEIRGWTALVTGTRHDARYQLLQQAARTGADGVVLGVSELNVWEERCVRTGGNSDSEAADHIAEAMLLGTAVAAFRSRRAERPATLTVMPLDSRATRLRRRVQRDLGSMGADPYVLRERIAELDDLDG